VSEFGAFSIKTIHAWTKGFSYMVTCETKLYSLSGVLYNHNHIILNFNIAYLELIYKCAFQMNLTGISNVPTVQPKYYYALIIK
jgi:hypothetical protein